MSARAESLPQPQPEQIHLIPEHLITEANFTPVSLPTDRFGVNQEHVRRNRATTFKFMFKPWGRRH